jgi:uncharacterized protein (TIGR04255 family)
MIDAPDLPDFSTPPAIETLLGFYYAPLKGWATPNFGLFWQDIRKDYPQVEVQPSVAEQGLQIQLKTEKSRLMVTGEVPVRWRYFHRSGQTLLQIQSDTFIQNWRKGDKAASYLHYRDLRPSFFRMWERYCKFLQKNDVQAPTVRECEVTYVNHIDKGAGWRTLQDLGTVITGWSGLPSGTFLPSPEVVSMNVIYPIREKPGRLRVMLEPGIRDGQETLQLTLMARCRPDSSKTSDLLDALDVARQWVVRGFTDFTTTQMHQIWGKTDRRKKDKK